MNRKFFISLTRITMLMQASLFALSSPAPPSWLVMLYQNADDYLLEEDLYLDLNEAELAGSSPRVTIVAQCDRFQGGFDGDGDWTSAKRILLKKDADLNALNSKIIADLGEVNMADGKSLSDFMLWAIKTYPASKYVLILADHGLGWPGGWQDPDPENADILTMNEIETALNLVCRQTAIGKLEIIGFDACLMAQLEVFSTIASYAKYAVASQEIEPGLGWAYYAFLDPLNKNPELSGAELARVGQPGIGPV